MVPSKSNRMNSMWSIWKIADERSSSPLIIHQFVTYPQKPNNGSNKSNRQRRVTLMPISSLFTFWQSRLRPHNKPSRQIIGIPVHSKLCTRTTAIKLTSQELCQRLRINEQPWAQRTQRISLDSPLLTITFTLEVRISSILSKKV